MAEETAVTKFQRDTGDVLNDTLSSLIEGLTGIAASERKEYLLSVGRILQALRKGQFLSQLSREWNEYREKCRIKDDYQSTEQHYTCLQEMLDFLDKDLPDEARFNILKKILLVAATETKSDRNNVLPQQYMRVCRTLSSGELLVLSTVYRFAKEKHPTSQGADEWLRFVAKESGLVHPSLVEIQEEELIRKHLITPRKYPDQSGVDEGASFRLTSLGYDICRFVEEFDKIEQRKQDNPK